MSEQLCVEGRRDPAGAVRSLAARDGTEQVGEVRCVLRGALGRGSRLVRALVAEIDVRPAHTPELQPARPADLVELEVPLVAGIPLVTAPNLGGGARVPYERGHRPGGHTVHAIRRSPGGGPKRLGCDIMPFGVEPFRA